MKISMEQAAYIIGKTKKTIYNHKDRNKFSYEQDDEGRTVIDISELMRVYGSTPAITERIEELQNGDEESVGVITQNYTEKKPKKTNDNLEDKMIIVKLEAELEKEKALKSRVEDDVDYFKTALEKAQETAQKVTMLLENKKDSGAGEWEKSLKALENRLANQEKVSKETAEKEQKIIRQNRALKKALDEERNKSFFKKIFG
jgi:hypothetical protein